MLLAADFTVNELAVTTTKTIGLNTYAGLYKVEYDGRTLLDDLAISGEYPLATQNGVIHPHKLRVSSGGNRYVLNWWENFRQSTTTPATWNGTTHTLTQTFDVFFDPVNPTTTTGVYGEVGFLIGHVVVSTLVEEDPIDDDEGARLSFTITTSELSSSPASITGVIMNVVGLDFGSSQGEPEFVPLTFLPDANAVMADSVERPAVLGATLTESGLDSGFIAIADDETRSVHSTASDAPFGGEKPRFVTITKRSGGPSNYVHLGNFADNDYVGRDRFGNPLSPGGSDIMQFSMRFGPEGTSLEEIAGDVLEEYTDYYVDQFSFDDRRPMMSTFIAQTIDPCDPNRAKKETFNPNGYRINLTMPVGSEDPTIAYPWGPAPDGLDDPGDEVQLEEARGEWIDQFVNGMLAHAALVAGRAASMGSQGVVTWDIEGARLAAAHYAGAPDSAYAIAPELGWIDPDDGVNPDGLTVAQRYFEVFENAGLKTGVTVRPETISLTAPGGQTPSEVLNTIVTNLTDKIEYAKDEWGSTLFYIDSTINTMDSYVFKRVADAVPGTMLIPENTNVGDFAYGSGYDSINLRYWLPGTPTEVRNLYPDAFSVLSVVDHGSGFGLDKYLTPPTTTPPALASVYDSVADAITNGDVALIQNRDATYDATNHYLATNQIYTDAYGQIDFPNLITTGQPYTVTLGPGSDGAALMGGTWHIDWGDGTTPYEITFDEGNFPSGAVTASHTYSAASEVREITATFYTSATYDDDLAIANPLTYDPQVKVTTFELPVFMSASPGATYSLTGAAPQTLTLESGTFDFVADVGPWDLVALEVEAGAAAVLRTTQNFASVTVNGASGPLPAGSVLIDGAGVNTLVTDALTVAGGATLDLNDGNLIHNYSGSSPISTIVSLIVSGYNAGAWEGDGITSTAAEEELDGLLALAYGDAVDLGIVSLDGVPIAGDAILVKSTYVGDANLDGDVDEVEDLGALIDGFTNSGTNWSEGDFDYDGAVDMADFDLLFAAYRETAGNLEDFQYEIQTSSDLTVAEKSAFLNRINLDGTFDDDGMVTTDVSGNRDMANAVVTTSGGKIYSAGQIQGSGGWDFGLVRYNSNGSLDTGFDTDGMVRTSITSNADMAYGMALQGNGKIVVAGVSNWVWATSGDFAVVRYNTDGSLDTGFDSDGIVTTDISGSGSLDIVYAVVVDGSGNIVVAGGNGSDFAVVRYTSSGALDTSFNSTGIKTIDFGAADEAHALAIDGSGNIVVVGTSGNFIAVARLTSSGALDTSFSSDGKDTVQIQGTSSGVGVGIQSTGKIVVTGYTNNGITNNFLDFGMVRYNSNGTLDTSFGTAGTGKVQTDIYSDGNTARASFLASDDKILIAGNLANHDWSMASTDFAVARYNANGTLDTSFAGAGYLTTDFGYRDEAMAITMDSEGCIILAGLTHNHISTGYGEDFALIRLVDEI